jgi:mannitol/fructose-specific phosphotransferase system IIA component (Ntr-type)
MKLAKILAVDQIILGMKAADHWSAIIELVEGLVNTGKLPERLRESTLESLRLREELVSTGVGGGVAIPHAFSDELEEVAAVFGRSDYGIDFEALDGAPVHLMILFVVPRRDYQLHLKTLAAIAKTFANPSLRDQLLKAGSREQIHSLLSEGSARPCDDCSPHPTPSSHATPSSTLSSKASAPASSAPLSRATSIPRETHVVEGRRFTHANPATI